MPDQITINVPSHNTPCGNCRHPFGGHYTTYDAKQGGCSHYDDDQRDGGPCRCAGFAIVMPWPQRA